MAKCWISSGISYKLILERPKTAQLTNRFFWNIVTDIVEIGIGTDCLLNDCWIFV